MLTAGKLVLGQTLSLISASAGVINGLLYEKWQINVPTLQSFLLYWLMLVVSALVVWFKRRPGRKDLAGSEPRDGAMALCIIFGGASDFLAGWLFTKAFSILSVPTAVMFAALTAPFAYLLQRPVLSRPQAIGLCLAVSSVILYSAWELLGSSSSHATYASLLLNNAADIGDLWLGILLAVSGAFSYALSNLMQERAAKAMAPFTLLLGFGAVGSLCSSVLMAVDLYILGPETVLLLRHPNVHGIYLILIGYTVLLLSFYIGIPLFLSRYSIVDFNLSLLTMNAYSLLGGVLLLGQHASVELFACLGAIIVGLLLYHGEL